jgi:hypothetical protein
MRKSMVAAEQVLKRASLQAVRLCQTSTALWAHRRPQAVLVLLVAPALLARSPIVQAAPSTGSAAAAAPAEMAQCAAQN